MENLAFIVKILLPIIWMSTGTQKLVRERVKSHVEPPSTHLRAKNPAPILVQSKNLHRNGRLVHPLSTLRNRVAFVTKPAATANPPGPTHLTSVPEPYRGGPSLFTTRTPRPTIGTSTSTSTTSTTATTATTSASSTSTSATTSNCPGVAGSGCKLFQFETCVTPAAPCDGCCTSSYVCATYFTCPAGRPCCIFPVGP